MCEFKESVAYRKGRESGGNASKKMTSKEGSLPLPIYMERKKK